MEKFQQPIKIPTITTFDGRMLLPSFQLPLTSGEIVGMHLDVFQIDCLLKYLQHYSNMNIFFRQEGHYERMTIFESLKFEKKLYNSNIEIDDALNITGLLKAKKLKIKNLSYSQLQRVKLAKLLIHEKPIHIIEEPYQNLDIETKRIVERTLNFLKEKGYTICLLSASLEDLMISTNSEFRIEDTGLEKFDLQEENSIDMKVDKQAIKLEKIPTKIKDKLVLFNPPEIDYIESVEGEVNVFVTGVAYPCSLTLSELERRLIHFGFFRCHRSYIVNLQKVREVITWSKNSYSLVLSGKERLNVPLSRSKLVELKEIIGI